MLIELVKEVNCPIRKSYLIKLATQTCRILKKKREFSLSVAIVKSKTSRLLNKRWRGINKPASVLSFSGKTKDKFVLPISLNKYLGEIIITDSQVHLRAHQEKVSYQKQFKFLFIHGLLHLLGYHHHNNRAGKLMEKIENKINNLAP